MNNLLKLRKWLFLLSKIVSLFWSTAPGRSSLFNVSWLPERERMIRWHSRSVWPDLAKFYKYLANFWWFISYLANCWSYFGDFLHYWANFHCCKWPNIEKESNHLVTLLRRKIWDLIYYILRIFSLKPFLAIIQHLSAIPVVSQVSDWTKVGAYSKF